MRWNPVDYAKHSDAQLKWAEQLKASLVLLGSESILDVGCGDGKITANLATSVPNGRVVGIDSSAEMVDYAKQTYPESQYTSLSFQCQDARSLPFSSEFDLVFSNAVLHWVNDHPAFLQGAYQALKPGGKLILSCGGAGNAAGILLAFQAVTHRPTWSAFFSAFQNPYFFFGPEDYQPWLSAFDVQTLALVPKDMIHQGQKGFEAWIRTTWMPFTEKVPVTQREEFISEVVQEYLTHHPIDDQGLTHVKMVRLELHATKAPSSHSRRNRQAYREDSDH